MSARPSSPAPSISLLEIKSETRLVLGAFLRRTVGVPLAQRPGRVGGMYRDPNKFSASPKNGGGRAEADKDGRSRPESDSDSLASQSSSEGEKKHRFRDLLKKHLQSRSMKSRSLRDSQRDRQRDSQKTGGVQEEAVSPYSSPSENGSDAEEEKHKRKKKKKKLKSPFTSIIRRIKSKKDPSNPRRPTSLVTSATDPGEPLSSPNHPPEFYNQVAETVDKFAQKHILKQKDRIPAPAAAAKDKEVIVQQLVEALQTQGDAINVTIQSSPFLRNSLANMSYPSFASLVDMFTSQTRPPAAAPPASPTLSRIAMTMEVSRRVVTATGTQRIRGYAERYMEKFNPWVKSHGGWEGIFQLEEFD